MSPFSRSRSRRVLVVLLLLALTLVVALDLLRPRSFLRGLFAPPPEPREPVIPQVDDAVRELRKRPLSPP